LIHGFPRLSAHPSAGRCRVFVQITTWRGQPEESMIVTRMVDRGTEIAYYMLPLTGETRKTLRFAHSPNADLQYLKCGDHTGVLLHVSRRPRHPARCWIQGKEIPSTTHSHRLTLHQYALTRKMPPSESQDRDRPPQTDRLHPTR
jgi:hypothetical protein